MKELNRKVFNTIFIILSLFVVIGVIIYNVSSYKREYEDVSRNIIFMNDRNKRNDNPPNPIDFEKNLPNPMDRELENMMIMDYEVYSVILEDSKIEKIINHSDTTCDFDVEKIAKKILTKKQGLKIGNLYTNKYSYNYSDDTIVIVNTKNINERLILILIKSMILLIICEIVIILISKALTKRITKPASDAFDKQKDFIADASHELKTPLAVIMASSDELKSDKKNEKYVENIKYESERMSTLIKGLLDLSKLEKGVSINNYKEEDLSKIIERTCLTFDSVAFEQNIKIDTKIEDNIIFHCSKEEMERLVSIILDNAVKHSEKDSTITVKAQKDKNNIMIDITNKGDPIKEGDEEKIFERFYRADKGRNREANRYGLGLAIAKNIATNHKGTIKAFSSDGKTTFTIKLKK